MSAARCCASCGVGKFAALATLAAAASGCIHRVPEIRGQVVDARTGAPIAGAVVKRELYEPGAINVVDTSAPTAITRSLVKARSDSEGGFVFPAYTRLGQITGMAWLVYEPGYMPASGCEQRAEWGVGGCSGFGSFMGQDPWKQVTFRASRGGEIMKVQMWPPTTEGITWPYGEQWTEWNPATGKNDLVKHFPEDVDPWGEYFRRLNTLAHDGWLHVGGVVEQAVGYLSHGGALTESSARTLLEVVDYFYLPGGKIAQHDAEAIVRGVSGHCNLGCSEPLARYLRLVGKKVAERSRGGGQ